MHGNDPGVDDPVQILRVLPARYRDQFRAEYATAVERARDPGGYQQLAQMLHLWRLRATAYADPTYPDRLAATGAADATEDVAAEQVVAGWPAR